MAHVASWKKRSDTKRKRANAGFRTRRFEPSGASMRKPAAASCSAATSGTWHLRMTACSTPSIPMTCTSATMHIVQYLRLDRMPARSTEPNLKKLTSIRFRVSGCMRIFCADSIPFSNANEGGGSVSPRNLQKFAKLLNALQAPRHKQNTLQCTVPHF